MKITFCVAGNCL